MTRPTKESNAIPAQSKPRFINSRRRGFLQSAAIASAAGTAGVATATASELAAVDDVLEAASGSKGYEETDHVRDYYRKARL